MPISKDPDKRARQVAAILDRPGGHGRVPAGYRSTRAYRFTLPVAAADVLEGLPKAARDALMEGALAALDSVEDSSVDSVEDSSEDSVG